MSEPDQRQDVPTTPGEDPFGESTLRQQPGHPAEPSPDDDAAPAQNLG